MRDFSEAIRLRHSVRAYEDGELDPKQVDEMTKAIDKINETADLDFSLHQNEDIFSHLFLGYGFIKNCHNYILCAGKDSPDLAEKVGYYGEYLVLLAQELGLNTCWVGGTYRKKDVDIGNPSSRLVCVIALGKGKGQGNKSKSKPIEEYYQGENIPEWFINGMEAVALAPSAVNQKKWRFTYLGGEEVKAESFGKHLNDVDLGIAKLHFELGSKKKVFSFPPIED